MPASNPTTVLKLQVTTITQRATHAVLWSALEISARYGLQFVVTVVLARLLTPSDFGLIAMLLVFTSFATLLSDGGLSSALVQKQHTTDNEETSVFLVNLIASCVLAALLWLIAPTISTLYRQPALTSLLQVLVLVLPLGGLAAVPNAKLSQSLDFRTRTIAELIASVSSATLALVLAAFEYGVWSLVWQAVSAAGLRACFLWKLSDWRPHGRFEFSAFAKLFRFGGFLLVANALNLVSIRLQLLLIGHLFNARTLGFYVLAQDTQQAPAQFISGLLNRVGLPIFSVVASDSRKLSDALGLSLRVSFFVFAPCMLGIAAVASPMILLLYGAAWEPAARLLSILALSTVFWPLHVLNLAALSALSRSDLVLKLEVVKGITTIPLILISAPFGAEAVAWSVLGSSIFSVVINTWWSRKLFGFGLIAQLRELLPILLIAGLSASIAYLVLEAGSISFLRSACAILLAMAFYVVSAVSLNLKAWHDSVSIVQLMRTNQGQAQGDRR